MQKGRKNVEELAKKEGNRRRKKRRGDGHIIKYNEC